MRTATASTLPPDLAYLLPLIERVSRLLLHLLELVNPDALRFPERMRLTRTLRRIRAACESSEEDSHQEGQ